MLIRDATVITSSVSESSILCDFFIVEFSLGTGLNCTKDMLAVDFVTSTKDNWVVKLFTNTIYTLIAVLVIVAAGRVDSYAQACNITSNTCPPEKPSCQPTYGNHGVCIVDPNTPPTGGESGDPCSSVGCSGGCGTGLICRDNRAIGKTCVADTTNACGELPPDKSCTLNGCGDPKCGTGFSCDEGKCVFNTTCVGNVIDVPYEGPKIDSLARLIALIYNVMFPGALLIGVIMIIKGGYELMTSEGNPQLARVGQEDLTAAIMGTVFIIMSGLILRMIIVQVLGGTVAF